MPVVKAKQAQRQHQSAIVMDLSDMEREGARIVAEARAEAAKIVEESRAAAAAEAAAIKESARAAGHAEGFAAGEAQGHKAGHDEAVAAVSQALSELITRWAQMLDVIEQNLPTHVADAKTDLVKLALAIAERVTRQEAMRNRQVAQDTVTAALALVGAGRTVSLLVHPSEVEALESYLPDLLAKLRTVSSVELHPDESISPGGCMARFGAGEVDATVETQLQRIADELLSERS